MGRFELRPGIVKICSLREVAHAEFVVDAGADLFGLIFADARRKVDVATAKQIAHEVRDGSGGSIRSVGVFVDQPADEINGTADQVGLDIVQLHGSEPPDFAASIERPIIRAFRSQNDISPDSIDERLRHIPEDHLLAALVDGFRAGQPGGSGAVADWSLAEAVARRHPVILAGGLTPETVGAGIEAVKPIGVDVSSGVEVEGQKDRERIIQFVEAARAAFAKVGQSAIST